MDKKLESVTLPDSGVTLQIRRLGPVLANDIRKRMKRNVPKPAPPMQEIDVGGEKRLEPNEAHPEYAAALQEYNADLAMFFIEELVKYGVVCEIDAEEVAQLRAMGGDDLPKDDVVLYVTRLAITSQADMATLQNSILGRFQPTEAAVKSAAENFPGKV